jgi:hypothetical protein
MPKLTMPALPPRCLGDQSLTCAPQIMATILSFWRIG